MKTLLLLCTALDKVMTFVSFRLMMQILFDLVLRIHIISCEEDNNIYLTQKSKALNLHEQGENYYQYFNVILIAM